MRAPTVAAWLLLAVVETAWAQSAQRPQPSPSPAPRAGSAVRHGSSSAPKPSVSPAPPKPSPAPQSPASRPSSPPPSPGPPPIVDSPFASGPFTYAPRYRPSQRRRPPYYWGSGYFGYGAPYELAPSDPPPGEPRESPNDQLSLGGTLDLELEPRTADVYVDGFYVGTADDVAQNGLALRVGRHWVDVRAAGYDTLTIPVNIVSGQFVRYRRELVPASAPVSRVGPVPGPQTIYVIPGCYAGNRPPDESALPRGCDIAKLRTVTP